MFSEKQKAERVLLELGWFVGRHHELVPVHRAEIRELDLTDAIRRAVIQVAPGWFS